MFAIGLQGVCPPYEIGGKLNVVKQGGAAGKETPLSRCASLPPYFAGGIQSKSFLNLTAGCYSPFSSILGKSASALVMAVPAWRPPQASPWSSGTPVQPRYPSPFSAVFGMNADNTK